MANVKFDIKGNITGADFTGIDLPEIDLSEYAELLTLRCSDMKLTNLDLSANPKLQSVDCRGTPIQEIIVADIDNLPETFLYDGNPIIQEQ
jgi:uncharacterized protein YjbI with pentapeptide repeats